jgi:malyl-CoA/(S)-citramalyl-CoA lyase
MRAARLHRSELTVPGSNRRMLEKASELDADLVMLDLEDSVAVDEKAKARRQVIDAVRSSHWRARGLSLRINGLDTEWCYRDLVDVVENVGEALDVIMVPKVGSAADVHFVATLLDQIEASAGLTGRLGLSVLIETAAGMAHVNEIAAACPERMEAMVFGVADYSASLQSTTTSIGGVDQNYAVLTGGAAEPEREFHWGDQWHHALSAIAVACRANGVRPIDGPYGDFTDRDGYLAAARRAAVLGYEGKWAVHPSQVPLANEVFTPGPEAVERTRRIVSAMEEAAAEGRGAVTLDGALIDAASVRMARHQLARLEQIAAEPALSPALSDGRPTR